tara:strand:+ start:167 stop:340 length:174 start_codon:yes stop_codon:yes gene_type:complete
MDSTVGMTGGANFTGSAGGASSQPVRARAKRLSASEYTRLRFIMVISPVTTDPMNNF